MAFATVDNINMFEVGQMLANLNDQQREAAMAIDGRVLVIAGAGSGKTATLTTRIANMIASGIDASSIFCATFTNKAAGEMKERLEVVAGKHNMDKIWMGTFHSQCVRILRKHASLLGYNQDDSSNFIIYDTSDTLKVIERVYKQLDVDKKIKPGYALNYIDTAKNNLWTPEYCLRYKVENDVDEVLAKVYQLYQSMMLESNSMDFGDLIMNTVIILEEFPEAAEYWQSKFKYILSDEYQDANPAQFALLKLLAEPHYNIFVVGDPDQSIYRFRGSDVGLIMNFEKHFSPCEVIKLETNYRSTNVVVQAGNSLISNNPAVYDKVLNSHKEEGDKITLASLTNEFMEAAYVSSKIKSMVMSGDYDWKDFSILYRSGYQSMVFEQFFAHNFIPAQVIGGLGFFEREEIKDSTSYLRVLVNRRDDAAMLRILNKPTRGIGKTTQDRLEKYASDYSISIYRAMRAVDDIPEIRGAAANKVKAFLDTLDYLEDKMKSNMSLSKYVEYVLDQTGINLMYKTRMEKELEDDPESKAYERLENIQELINLINYYEIENPDKPLNEFLQELSLVTDLQDSKEDPNTVKLMTMHGSKGLEFPVVFVVGMNENIFPSWRSRSDEEIEEERRICYVALTRAESKLFLTHVEQRSRPDGRGVQNYDPSRFISEISEDLIEVEKVDMKKN